MKEHPVLSFYPLYLAWISVWHCSIYERLFLLPSTTAGATFAVKVFAGNPGFTCRPGLTGSMIISFLMTLQAHIIVGSHEGREYTKWREVLKFLASEIIKLLLNMRNPHCYLYVPL